MSAQFHKTAHLFFLLSASSMCLLAAVPAAAGAAEEAAGGAGPDNSELDEIVVTAQRRTENSQRVPLSVLTVGGDRIEASGYRDVTDLQYLAPGVQYDPTQGAAFQIRGVGTTSFDFSNAKSVSVVVDDVVMDGQRANGLIGMVDIAAVEVLMGPQGTLFGKNSTSGVISVRTNRPRIGDTSVRASASYGEHNDRALNATVNVPLGADAAIRVSAFDQGQDGFGRNVTLDRLIGSVHEYGGRAQLLVEPMESFSIIVSGDYAHHWDSSVRTPVSGQPAYVTAMLNGLGVYPGERNADTADSQFGEIETEEWGFSARIETRLASQNFRSISAFRSTMYNNSTPANLLPIDKFAFIPFNFGHLSTGKVSQEFHISSDADKPISYLVGLFYNRLEATQTQYQWATLGAPMPRPVLYALTGAIGRDGNTSLFRAVNETMAAFGQLRFEITPAFSVTLGGRYTHDNNSQSLNYINTDPVAIMGYRPVFVGTSAPPVYSFGRVKGDNFSLRVAPEYQISDSAMVYASFSTGYKPAGIAFVGNRYAPYNAETVKAWEAGLKSEWFGRKLRFNINAFRSDFTDFQATILTKVPDGAGGTLLATAIGNAGGLRSQGIETSIAVRPLPILSLSASGTYTDAVFTDYVYNPTTNYTGTRLPNAPKWAATFAADLDVPLAADWRLKTHADYAWRDKYWTVVGQPDWSFVPSYGLANARIAVARTDDRVEAGIYARNLFDTWFSTGYQIYGNLGLLHYTTPNARRTAGLFVNLKF